MSTRENPSKVAASHHAGILERTVHAFSIAEAASASLADCLASKSEACYRAVREAEEELDRIDREIDASVTAAIAEVTPAQARELLSSLKMLIDLERIGDLLAFVANCARALGNNLDTPDLSDLVKMASIVEKMLGDAHDAYVAGNVDRALAVLRADAEVDRIRNLAMIRHLEMASTQGPKDSVQVLLMAQALERAGDHVKNLAEEICNLATGLSVRHVLRTKDKSDEQMYLEYLRVRHGVKETAPADSCMESSGHATSSSKW